MSVVNEPVEFDYLPGMLPPVLSREPEWEDAPVMGWERTAKKYKRRASRRRAIIMTVIPLVLSAACFVALRAVLVQRGIL